VISLTEFLERKPAAASVSGANWSAAGCPPKMLTVPPVIEEIAMISLTDEGLAHLCVAAGAIPRRDRAAWLAEVAGKLEASAASQDRPKSQPMSDRRSHAHRTREYRQRQ
jgi:hypothetical protein